MALPRASFRFRLTADTLASGYRAELPDPGRTFTDKLSPMPGVHRGTKRSSDLLVLDVFISR
ncbi:MAG: hypothetical protein CWE10_16515 [Symbiobacterium thermophilum]|uniref:Uncharacterized protein n=1 Tax=Symbiobacterium thermophilum TaxID=2734 RepID=A0A953IB23_SYMTR|nr:hypothetical protein [Symbiobacterium thermophilum]